MKKRIVILTNKKTGQNTPFPSVISLVRTTGKEILGIGANALYNALSLHNGVWENTHHKVSYRNVNEQPQTWE